jgi:predicted aminopeptidase
VFQPNPYDPRTGSLRSDRAWVLKFIKNAATFPKGTHDDDVDAFTQLVRYLKGTHSAMLEFLKIMAARDADRLAKEAAAS